MIISHKHKFIFVKTFKTAGSSIEKYLYDYLDKDDVITGEDKEGVPTQNAKAVRHRTASWIKKYYPTEWDMYYKFSVDRNPWDVAVSWYHWMKYAERLQEHTFDTWIKQVNLTALNNWKRYTINNEIAVDKVLKYEDLENEIQTIPVPYNGELKTTFVKSGHRQTKDYKSFYTNETRLLVQNNFSEVIDLFGYAYEN